jgi:DNA-binding NtrC family response regulator
MRTLPKAMKRILIIEDEAVIRSTLKRLLERHDFDVSEARSVAEACALEPTSFDLIISDLRLPGDDGTEMITRAPGVPVLIMTSYASMQSAIDAMKLGASDYIAKPFDHDELVATVQRVLRQHSARTEFRGQAEPHRTSASERMGQMIGESQVMRSLYAQIRKIAPTPVTVLIHGESGTGKELVANAIHENSPRAKSPFIAVNCAAIPESLIESELFGHERGAFTGAVAARQGLVEAAEGGTLFLDEIGELPLEAQARLLRVIQEREVRRLGSVSSRQIDIRLIAATHRNLRNLVQTAEFREDLYYRLQVIELTIPPLRERGQDAVLIARHLIAHYTDAMALEVAPELTDDACERILQYTWPGNIRELENAMQRAIILVNAGSPITADALNLPTQSRRSQGLTSATSELNPVLDAGATEATDDASLEDYFIQFVLEHQDQMNETELAQKLGISRKSLWERRQKLGIPKPKTKSHG